MPRYAWHGESLTTDILGALAAMGYGFARTYAVLKKPERAKLATIGDAVVGAGGLIAKNYVGNPLAHEVFEALGFSGFANLGVWAAATMEKQNSIPVWRPEGTTSKVVQTVPQYAPPAPVFVPPAPVAAAAPSRPSDTSNYEFEY